MAPRRSVLPRVAVLAGLVVGVSRLGTLSQTYAVKGSWQGNASALRDSFKGDFGTVAAGLAPRVSFPAVSYSREGLGMALSVDDGRLNADYTTKLDGDTTFNLRVNDEKAWKASLLGHDASLRVRGQGTDLENLFWEASQDSSVEDVGDVRVEFNSDKAYNLTVARHKLAEIAGVHLDAKVRATNAGVTSRLGARRSLPGGAEATYSVENPVGVYKVGRSTHNARLSVPVAGGEAALSFEGDSSSQAYEGSYGRGVGGGHADLRVSHTDGAVGYNVSYARGLADTLPVDAGVHLGIDDEGVYGRVTAKRDLGHGIDAEYEANARLELGNEQQKSLSHALKLSNKLGYAQLVHSNGEAPRVRMGYDFDA